MARYFEVNGQTFDQLTSRKECGEWLRENVKESGCLPDEGGLWIEYTNGTTAHYSDGDSVESVRVSGVLSMIYDGGYGYTFYNAVPQIEETAPADFYIRVGTEAGEYGEPVNLAELNGKSAEEITEIFSPAEIGDEIRKPENLVEPRTEYAGEDLGEMWRNPDLETPVDMRRLEQLESVATCGGCPEIIGALSSYTGPDYRTPVEYPVYYFPGLGLLVVDYSTDTENDFRMFGAIAADQQEGSYGDRQTAAALADTLYENFSVR